MQEYGCEVKLQQVLAENPSGRMVVRKSGTEPLVRVMAEALEHGLMKDALKLVVDAVKSLANR